MHATDVLRLAPRALAVCAAILFVACGESEDHKSSSPSSGGSGGSGGSATSGGAAGSTGGIVVSVGGGGMMGVGAFGGNLIVNPPPTVNRETCASVVDDGSVEARSACFYCCADKGFVNDALFNGTCACGMPVDTAGETVCASETSEACGTCCLAANYSGAGSRASMPGACYCIYRSDSSVCASTSTQPMARNACAVCCINAGYVSSVLNSNVGCECQDG